MFDAAVLTIPTRNFRPLLRLQLGDIRRTIYRSSALCSLTPPEANLLKGLASLNYFDLRTSEEAGAEPLDSDLSCEITSFPLDYGGGAWHAPAHYTAEYIVSVYTTYVEQSAPLLGSLLDWLSAPGEGSAVVACSAGKDRTGVVAYLLLNALCAPPWVAAHDYVLSFQCVPDKGSTTPYARSFASMRESPPHVVLQRFTDQLQFRFPLLLRQLATKCAKSSRLQSVELWNARQAAFEWVVR